MAGPGSTRCICARQGIGSLGVWKIRIGAGPYRPLLTTTMPQARFSCGKSRVVVSVMFAKYLLTKHLVRKSCRDLVTTCVPAPLRGHPSRSCVNPMTSSAIPDDIARRRSRRDARVRAFSDLKERRARLAAGTSIKPEFEYELLTMFVRNELGAAVTMPALYALFAIACMFWAPTVDAVVWLDHRHRRQGGAARSGPPFSGDPGGAGQRCAMAPALHAS